MRIASAFGVAIRVEKGTSKAQAIFQTTLIVGTLRPVSIWPSMARLTPRFSADRTVREYTEQHYLPLAASYRRRAENKGEAGGRIVNWRRQLEQKWAALHFGELKVETRTGQHFFEVYVCLNDLDPQAVRVELYADGVAGGDGLRQEMTRSAVEGGPPGWHRFNAAVPASRAAEDVTVRLMPHCDGGAVPLEEARIHWRG